MNGRGQGYQQQRYGNNRREPWDEDASSSSAYETGQMSPYNRGDVKGHHNRVPNNGYSSDPGSVGSSEDGPTYVLEHLATFRVSPESGLVYPSDGMRRLLHMEKTSGIWTQKMMLKLEKKWVFILSHENGDVVEKFPMELIREPTAFTSGDPKELYNNIFIFVVAEDPKRNYDNPTEMHIFQCMRVSAKDVVEEMKLFMSGKSSGGVGSAAIRSGGARNDHIPPPPQEEAPEPPLNGYRGYPDNDVRGDVRGLRSGGSSVSHNDEVSSTSSERYERDVAILNNCFDDIERFIGRLQHTAAATRELERRRRSRKSKKKDIGDGMLSMRAKPPPEREFVDIFQKFKLSFNLLAKLRAYIRDPNAPELVHFLFTPLALLVDASRDNYDEPTLPPKVISPLLTQDAIDLLTNCLTSRETELWQSLGDAWVVPRDAWKYPASPYRPIFYSGWTPEISDEQSDKKYPMYHPDSHVEANPHHHHNRDDIDDESDRIEVSPLPSVIASGKYRQPPQNRIPVTDYPLDSVDPLNQRKFLEDMKSRGAKIVQVTYPRTANNDKELSVVRGEYLEVVDDSRKWWKAANSRGQTAHVPHTIVTPYMADDPSALGQGPGIPNRPVKKATRHHPGDSSEDDNPRYRSPPPPKQASGQKNETDLMNMELKMVLEEFRKARPHLEITKTPDVYFDQNSSPKQIQFWLKEKGFDESIRKQFDGVDGQKMFSLSKKQLENYCGKSHGARLASQITIQRKVSGFNTARSTELKGKLQSQRQKIELSNTSNLPNMRNLAAFSSDEEKNVTSNFKFLHDYPVNSDEESEADSVIERVITRKPNTMGNQIQNQHKKIVKNPSHVITNR